MTASETAGSIAKRGLILFAHGARDPLWAVPFQRLQGLLQALQPGLRVELAFLELMTPDLPHCVAQMTSEGIDDITVVPVFLGQGGHIRRDLPKLVVELAEAHPALRLKVAAPVGEDDAVLNAMAQYCVQSLSTPPVQGI